jgi:RND family efflux transporter MFP subunit
MPIHQPLQLCFYRCRNHAIPVANVLAIVLAIAFTLSACGPQPPTADVSTSATVARDKNKSATPPVSVSVATASLRSVAPTVQATGQISSARIVEVKPQVAGMIANMAIREGDFVKEGQLLLALDSRHEAAQVDKAKAQLARDQAALKEAQRQNQRAQELFNKNFIAQGSFDTTQTQLLTQEANVDAAEAALKAAQVALSYTRIYAPASGRVGAITVSKGSQVGPNLPAVFTITQLHPILVSFAIPQQYLSAALTTLAHAKSAKPQVKVNQPNAPTPHLGRLVFVDSQIDAAGTVRLKAELDNKALTLWPGAFVSVELALGRASEAIVIPNAAIVQGPEQASVWVVDDEAKASMRKIQLIQSMGTEAAVSGLQAGDQVIVDGRQNIKPGSKVMVRQPTKSHPPQGKISSTKP